LKLLFLSSAVICRDTACSFNESVHSAHRTTVLSARIDRLSLEGKTLLQTLAVIAKEFSLSLLKHVVGYQEERLQQLLTHLRDAEFIYEQLAFPDVEYIFKHALTQEVAYNSMLAEQRKVVHERTA
jgi:predicted ATPase